nr:spermatogenesis-associated protein 48-like isoform X1 [Ciona intestinalis]|eukprot:XP_009858706.1 spermatogenesis-associated protein 48-like isoform X1 [Ciona intestinalis]
MYVVVVQGRLKESKSFIKWNKHSQAPHQGYPLTPHRDGHDALDPTSGYLGAGTDIDLKTNIKKISSMNQLSDKIQLGTPTSKPPASGRPQTPPRAVAPEHGGKWASNQVSDVSLRAKLGGWTSNNAVKPKNINDSGNLVVGTFTFKPGNWRDEAAKYYMFSSSTQTSNRMVDWDKRLPPKLLPCPSTLEKTPDPISQNMNIWPKRFESDPEFWQTIGRSWDWFQFRNKNHGNRPYSYTSHYRKSGHIPCYGGCVGAYNFEDKDHPHEEYRPLTSLRTPKPRYTDTAHRPNIPHYKGCVHWTATHSANNTFPAPQPPSTAHSHRKLPTSPNTSIHSKKGPLSRMVTTVPPKNPFNQVEDQQD